MTTGVEQSFLKAGLDKKDIDKLVRSKEFKNFLALFDTPETLAQALQKLIFIERNVAIRIARALKNNLEGRAKTDGDTKDLELFTSSTLRYLAASPNRVIAEEIHGLGVRGVEIMDIAILELWNSYCRSYTIHKILELNS